MRKVTILLAEDHAMVRDGLKMIINAQPDMEIVAEAADGRAAVTRAQAVNPDVVVMDLSMPRLNGLKAAELLREQCPHVKIVALTRHTEAGYIRELLRAGAVGYVLKQSSSASLLAAIRAVALGGTYLDPAVAHTMVNDYAGHHAHHVRDQPVSLTPREVEVVRLVASGYANKEMAARLGVSVNTIETHKANAMEKLGLHSRIDLVRFARMQGWLEDDA